MFKKTRARKPAVHSDLILRVKNQLALRILYPFNLYYELANALLGALLPFCTFAQNQTLDSIAVSTKYLDEVVVTDSRFALKRSQSGKTVIKIKQEKIQQFSGLGLEILLSTHLGIDVIGKNLYSGTTLAPYPRGGRNRQVLILIDGIRVSIPPESITILISML